ncbi:alpha/beta hydrolase [Litoreibacter roseus]|uniref:Alpha/beta hydrolase n=1 Tax=Litoreibacter roseus TaxID=2601869 RepID=A0A6N6JHF6_9RHOB|nr:alpha/beta hydrolase [Litoreibacter roseus]GFE65676.1 alpha/beta hydrolase [Litoreibacter roseus]
MRGLIRAAILLGLIFGGLLLTERLVVYAFDPREVEPATLDLKSMSAHRFEASSGRELVYWSAPPRKGRPTVLYLHGNAGNLSNRAPRFRIFLKRGYGLIAPAYPSSSGSEGWPVERAIRADSAEFYKALIGGEITGTPVVPVVYGESIGAAVAIHLNADTDVAPKAILLEAPFTSLKDVAEAIQPELLLLTGLMQNAWSSKDHASELEAPLLVLHGANDPLIPIAQGRAIFEAASSPKKQFYKVPGAGHIDVWTRAAQRRIFEFLGTF